MRENNLLLGQEENRDWGENREDAVKNFKEKFKKLIFNV